MSGQRGFGPNLRSKSANCRFAQNYAVPVYRICPKTESSFLPLLWHCADRFREGKTSREHQAMQHTHHELAPFARKHRPHFRQSRQSLIATRSRGATDDPWPVLISLHRQRHLAQIIEVKTTEKPEGFSKHNSYIKSVGTRDTSAKDCRPS